LFDDRSNAAESNTLGDRAAFGRLGFAVPEQVIHGRAARIGDADDNVLVLFLQIARHAGQCAATADRADEAVDLAAGLVPDFRRGRDVVGFTVVGIIPLVGENDAALFGFLQLFRQAPSDVLVIVRIRISYRRHLDQLRAKQPQHVLFFLALRIGDDDDGAVATRIGDQRQSDAGIAGGRLHHQAAGSQFAAIFSFQDHLPAGAILDRAARIHELGLAEDGTAGRLGSAPKLDQWRMADGVNDAVADLHARFR